MKEKGERGSWFIRVLLVIGIFIVILSSSGEAWCASISQEKFVQLNPEAEELSFFSMVSPLTFHFDEDGKNLLLIQFTFQAKDDNWRPWLNQAEGEPAHILGDGFLYSQHIYFASPDQGTVTDLYQYTGVFATGGRIAEAFDAPLSLNFNDLQAINPGFKYYKKLSSPGDEESNVFLYAPDGKGLMFLGLENGDIFALVLRDPELWRQIKSNEGYHPELGTFVYSEPFYLVDPRFDFNFEGWFRQMRAEGQKTGVGAAIDSNFVLEEMDLNLLMGMLQVEFRITNNSDGSFSLLIFEVVFFDEEGNPVAKGDLYFQNLGPGETGTFLGALFPEGEIDIDNPRFSLTLVDSL